MKRIITRESFGIIALVIVLIPEIAHTVYVFKENSHYSDPWFSWCYAIGIDVAILIFTVKGWKRTAVAYFIGTLAHNLVYQFWPESMWSSILICVMLSATIFAFSHLFYSKSEDRLADEDKNDHQEKEAQRIAEAKRNGVKVVALPYHCPACSEAFINTKKLNGHISGHKQKSEWHPEKYKNWEEENKTRALVIQKLSLHEEDTESQLIPA